MESAKYKIGQEVCMIDGFGFPYSDLGKCIKEVTIIGKAYRESKWFYFFSSENTSPVFSGVEESVLFSKKKDLGEYLIGLEDKKIEDIEANKKAIVKEFKK